MPGRQYYWYDTPDGQDLLKKTNFATKVGFMAAFPAAVFDTTLNQQKHIRTYFFRAGLYILPAMATGATFALTSQLLIKHVPQIKPEFSYMIGGVAAGSVVGAAVRSTAAGSVIGLYLSVIAYFAHDMHTKAAHYSTFFGDMPHTAVANDDDFLAADYRHAPPMSLPPPAARPAQNASMLSSWMM